jgi:hypothetical protein
LEKDRKAGREGGRKAEGSLDLRFDKL